MLFLLSLLVGNVFTQNGCDPGWSYFRNHCYKHILDPKNRVTGTQGGEACASHGGWLTGVDDKEEEQFILDLSRRNGSWESTVDAMKESPIENWIVSTPGSKYHDLLLIGSQIKVIRAIETAFK